MNEFNSIEIISGFISSTNPILIKVVSSVTELYNTMLEEARCEDVSWEHVVMASYNERIQAFEHSIRTVISLTDMYGSISNVFYKSTVGVNLNNEIEYLTNMIEEFLHFLNFKFVDMRCKNVQKDMRKLMENVKELIKKIVIE